MSSDRKTKGVNWTDPETRAFLAFCIEKRIISMMDGKRYRHIDLYKTLEPLMSEMGFSKDTHQMITKMKHLRELYFKCKRNNGTSGKSPMTFAYFNEMEELLAGRPSVLVSTTGGIDSSASTSATASTSTSKIFKNKVIIHCLLSYTCNNTY